MESLVDRVVNGRIFQNIASLVRRDTRNSGPSLGHENVTILDATARPQNSQAAFSSATPVPYEASGKPKRRKASESAPSNAPIASGIDESFHSYKGGSDASMHVYDDQTCNHFANDVLQKPILQQDSTPPPLTARYLNIFKYPGDYGEISSGLALTENLVWELNAVYQARDKIATYSSLVAENEEAVRELHSLIANFQIRIDEAVPDEDQSARFEAIHDGEEMLKERQDKIIKLRSKCQHWREEMEIPMAQMLSSLHFVLEDNNLIQDVLENSDDGSGDPEGEDVPLSEDGHRVPSLSGSEIARRDLEEQRQEAYEILSERRLHLQDAQAKVDDWTNHCNDEYYRFCQLQSEEVIDTTKTEFDVEMVQRGRVATQDLIQAEQDMDEIVKYSRMLGLDFEKFDQESGFISQIEDGHIESMDPAEFHGVDRKLIEKWMSEESEGSRYPEVEIDDWECQTVGVDDSVSIVAAQVATGKERKRIDRWRIMCGLAEVEAEQQEDQEQGGA